MTSICSLLKQVKDQEKEYKDCKSGDPFLRPSQKVCQVKDRVKDIQVIPVVMLSAPVLVKQVMCITKMYSLLMNFHEVRLPMEHNKQYCTLARFPKEASQKVMLLVKTSMSLVVFI